MFHGANRELSDAYARAIRDLNFRNRFAERHGISYFLRRYTSAVYGKPAWKVLNIIETMHRPSHANFWGNVHAFLYPLSDRVLSQFNRSHNLDDYNTLIPGHFLVGTSLIASAEFSVFDLKKQIFTLANDPICDWRFLEGLVRQLLAYLQQRPK